MDRCLAVVVLLTGCAEQETGWLGIARIDEHDDGSQDETLHRRLDADLRVIWEEWFSPLVRTLPGGRTEYTYDPEGHLIEETYDLYGDGVLDRWSVWTRDGDGRPLLEEHRDSAGEPTVLITYRYDGELLVEKQVESSGLDWEDEVATYLYDAEDRLVRVDHDYRIDGVIDRREEHTYLRAAPSLDGEYRLDVDGDGEWELDRRHRFDRSGRMVHSEGEEYGVRVVRDSDFDAVGRLVSSRTATERAESIETWRYDRLGLLQESVSAFRPLVTEAGEEDLTRESWLWTQASKLD